MKRSSKNFINELIDNLENQKTDLEDIFNSETKKFDALSEAAKESEKGDFLQSSLSRIEDALNSMQAAIDSLEFIDCSE